MHQLALPGIAEAAGSVLDVGGVTGPDIDIDRDPFGADQRALGSDWRRVGDDLRRASARVAQHVHPR
jgi:hypothetical protein